MSQLAVGPGPRAKPQLPDTCKSPRTLHLSGPFEEICQCPLGLPAAMFGAQSSSVSQPVSEAHIRTLSSPPPPPEAPPPLDTIWGCWWEVPVLRQTAPHPLGWSAHCGQCPCPLWHSTGDQSNIGSGPEELLVTMAHLGLPQGHYLHGVHT